MVHDTHSMNRVVLNAIVSYVPNALRKITSRARSVFHLAVGILPHRHASLIEVITLHQRVQSIYKRVTQLVDIATMAQSLIETLAIITK